MFKRLLIILTFSMLSFQAFSNSMSFERYDLEPYIWTSYLNNFNKEHTSYTIKYSFFEKTMHKVYYIYDKKNTTKVLYKYVDDHFSTGTLYKKLEGEKYEKVLSLVNDSSHTNKAHELGYRFAYNVLDKNNSVIAHLYYHKLRPWYQNLLIFETKATGGFELLNHDGKVLIKGFQPDNERYKLELMVAPKLSKDLLLAISNFMVPHTQVYTDNSDVFDE